jgi:hypothetical protein
MEKEGMKRTVRRERYEEFQGEYNSGRLRGISIETERESV